MKVKIYWNNYLIHEEEMTKFCPRIYLPLPHPLPTGIVDWAKIQERKTRAICRYVKTLQEKEEKILVYEFEDVE